MSGRDFPPVHPGEIKTNVTLTPSFWNGETGPSKEPASRQTSSFSRNNERWKNQNLLARQNGLVEKGEPLPILRSILSMQTIGSCPPIW